MSETTTALRMSRLVEEQFGDLGFSYYEVVSISPRAMNTLNTNTTGIAYSATG